MSRFIDRSGQIFGKLYVVGVAPKRGRHTMWLCRCSCGNTTVTSGDNLVSQHTRSCGCLQTTKRYPKVDLVGKRFGMLTVLSYSGRGADPKDGNSYWKCRCDCGNESAPTGSSLKKGSARSCGCQIRVGLLRANLKHGRTRTVEYRLWSGMLTRCYNKKEKAHKYYGGRGITVCRRWRGEGGFVRFFQDMGLRPAKGYEIERENNERGYSPTNCVWATKREQANNKRTTPRVRHDGKIVTLRKACEELGLNYTKMKGRLREGLTFAQAIAKPTRKYTRARVVETQT